MIELATALPVAAVLGLVARWAAPRLGAVDRPDRTELKPHPEPVPYLGGFAVAGAVAAGLASRGWHLPAGVAAALFVPVVLGLVDDAARVPPPVRLAVQVGLGAAMVGAGLSARALPGKPFEWVAAVVLYVTATNAVNMVDGMDGLAGGLGALSGAGIGLVAVVARHGHANGLDVLAVAAGAACVGFLLHNLPPARLYLGDNGAYFVGAALSIAALEAGSGSVAALAGASRCLGVFLLDLVLAVVRRVRGRAPLFEGDRGHLYDQLLARGLTVWGCLAVCFAVHGVLAGVGIGAAGLGTAGALALTGVAWAAALASLFAAGFVSYRVPAR